MAKPWLTQSMYLNSVTHLIMQITTKQLLGDHSILIDALKRGELVEITDHGQTLGIVQPTKKTSNSADQITAMEDFFGMHKDMPLHSVEEELRSVRQGWQSQLLPIMNCYAPVMLNILHR